MQSTNIFLIWHCIAVLVLNTTAATSLPLWRSSWPTSALTLTANKQVLRVAATAHHLWLRYWRAKLPWSSSFALRYSTAQPTAVLLAVFVLTFLISTCLEGTIAIPFDQQCKTLRMTLYCVSPSQGSTSHCFHTQHHVSVVYRNIIDHVCKMGTPEMMKQVLEGSTLEALEILTRNSAVRSSPSLLS